MVNNFDVCYYDDIAIHFDIGSVVRYYSLALRDRDV